MLTKGVDVSTWDGNPEHTVSFVDWANYSWDFTFIKVSEGTWEDPLFKINWAAARGRVYRSAYHFFRPVADPKQSVIKVLSILNGDVGELPLALDIEVTDGRTDVLDRAKSWLAWYEELTGIRPILYSSTSFLRDVLHCENYPYLAAYKFWQAEYPFDKMEPAAVRRQRLTDVLNGVYPLAFPKPPAPLKRTSFYQWTAFGTPDMVPGYYTGADGKKEVDLNFYQGTVQDMVFEFDLPALPDIPTGEEPMDEYVYEITPYFSDGCSVRPEPDTGNTKLNIKLPYGKKAYGNKMIVIAENKYENGMQVNQVNDVWLEVLVVDGILLPQPAYIAEIHLGRRVATITQISTIPTDPPPADAQPVKISIGGDGYQILSVVQNGNVVDIELKPTSST